MKRCAMAKEFKEFDRVFSKFKGKAFFFIECRGTKIDREAISSLTAWDGEGIGLKYKVHDQTDVQIAVYTGETAMEWQKFRVMLKGLTTQEKLWCLMWYAIWMSRGGSPTLADIRVNNYIGALVRGGQLSSDGKFTIQR
jgi:hypothetical protein